MTAACADSAFLMAATIIDTANHCGDKIWLGLLNDKISKGITNFNPNINLSSCMLPGQLLVLFQVCSIYFHYIFLQPYCVSLLILPPNNKTFVVHLLRPFDGNTLTFLFCLFIANFPNVCFTLRWKPGLVLDLTRWFILCPFLLCFFFYFYKHIPGWRRRCVLLHGRHGHVSQSVIPSSSGWTTYSGLGFVAYQ